MRVLVTGGCGYIGSALLPQLVDDDRVEHVTVLDSLASGTPRNLMGLNLGTTDQIAFHRGDVREYGDVEKAMRDVDTVIHLAAITGADSTHERREETFAVNYDGTENVIRAAGKLGVENVVFASSCNLYGRASSTDIDETTEPDPLNPYAEAKLDAETRVREAQADYGFDATALRMSTNYGYAPGVRFNLVVNHFVFRAPGERALPSTVTAATGGRSFTSKTPPARTHTPRSTPAPGPGTSTTWARPTRTTGSRRSPRSSRTSSTTTSRSRTSGTNTPARPTT
jgi:UDP-glucose 4-epimerase